MKYVCNLSPELQEKAREELHEDPDRRERDIEHIRQWLKKQPHITARTDDWTILRFLRGCKFSLDKTKKKLDMFYTCKGIVPEWFSNRDPLIPRMKELLELGEFLPLPGYDDSKQKVIVVRTNLHNPSTTSMEEIFKTALMVFDVLLEEDEQLSVAGVTQIIDLQGISRNHILQMTPSMVKKTMVIFEQGYPMRHRSLHYIHTPATFESIFSIFKAFMNEKMKKRVFVHGHDLESLQNAISKDLLPKEYGGNNASLEDIKKEWVQKVIAKRDWLMEDEKYKVDEKKRPGKPKTTGDIFGIEGSFRQLNVD